MTHTQFKNARKALGLSQNAMAKALGLKTSRAIRQYESGERSVSGPVAKLVGMLLEKITPSANATMSAPVCHGGVE